MKSVPRCAPSPTCFLRNPVGAWAFHCSLQTPYPIAGSARWIAPLTSRMLLDALPRGRASTPHSPIKDDQRRCSAS
jgi:hypothetical protein